MEKKESKKRNATVYAKIAALFGKKEHYVIHIMKIGRVNPLYFERLVSGRFSTFQAYNQCLNEEKSERGELPLSELPKVSEPVYVTDGTQLPVYDEEIITVDTVEEATNKVATEEVLNNLNVIVTAAPEASDETSIQSPTEEIGTKTIRCKCPVCDEEIEIKFNNK